MKRVEHTEYYKDGSVKGRGSVVGSQMDGYWEWYRKNGTKMRSGHFKLNTQVGEWITYDQQGNIYKVTDFDKKHKPPQT